METPWVEIIDPRSQELMYANIKTGDCSWEPPEGVDVRKMTDDQWWELYDNDCECYYYYCAATQQTVWERPDDVEVIPLSKLQSFQQDAMPPSPSESRRPSSTQGGDPTPVPVLGNPAALQQALGARNGSEDLVVSNIDDMEVAVVAEQNGHVETGDSQQADDHPVSNVDSVDAVGEQADATASNTGYGEHSQQDAGDPTQSYTYDQNGTTAQAAAGYDESATGYDQSGYDQSQAGYDQSQAGYDQSQAGYDQSQAGYDQSQAGYDQSQAEYDQSQAGYDQSQAGYDQSQAGYDQSQAGYDQSQAGYDQSQAGYDQSQAGYDQSQAGYDEQPEAEAAASAYPQGEPTVASITSNLEGCIRLQQVPNHAGMNGQSNTNMEPHEMENASPNCSSSEAVAEPSEAAPPSAAPKSASADAMQNKTALDSLNLTAANNPPSSAPVTRRTMAPEVVPPAQSPTRRCSTDLSVAGGPADPPAAPSLPTSGKFSIASYDKFEKPKQKRSFFSFKKKVTIENLLSWTKDPISSPMLRTNDKKRRKEAIDMFKQILVYMGDKKSKLKDKERDLVLHDIIGRTWTTTQLRDELFVQLCRQTTGNKNKKSLHAGWEIMCTALAFFPPSSMFHSYLEGYVYKHLSAKPIPDLKNAENPVHVYAQYCTKRLEQMRISGAKKGQKKPSLEEVEHCRNLAFNPSMFGDTLRDVFEMQLSKYPGSRVPWILSTLAKEVLKLNAKATEGIFRVPGDIDEVNNLKLKVDRFELGESRDPHIPASLLKLWFRELLDPVIPPELYDRCIRCASNTGEVLAIVDELPELNRNVLFFIIHFLQQFTPANVSYYTKMDVNNLAMVWAPNCLRCPYDDPTVLFENTRKEMTFVRTLVSELDTSLWDNVDL